jgi:hypothetical protein
LLWGPRDGVTARATIIGSAANADGTAGVNFEIRANAPFSQSSNSLYFESVRGWLKFFDKKVTLFGGKLDDNGVLRTYGGIDDDNMARRELGLHARIEAIPNLTLGATVMPGAVGAADISAATTNTLAMGNYRFGARYLIPGILGILGLFYDDAQTAIYKQDRLHMIYGFDILALRDIGFAALRADIGFYDMQDENYFNMKAGQMFTFRTGSFELGGRFRQSFLIGNIKDVKTGYTPELLFRLYGVYALTNTIRPRVEIGYLYGGYRGTSFSPRIRSDGYEAMNGRRSLVDPTQTAAFNRVRGFSQDTAYLAVIPQCEFQAGRNNTFIIGGGSFFDLSAGDRRYNYMAFVNLRSTF